MAVPSSFAISPPSSGLSKNPDRNRKSPPVLPWRAINLIENSLVRFFFRAFHRQCAWKQDVVFQVNMLVQVGLEGQYVAIQRLESHACIRRSFQVPGFL